MSSTSIVTVNASVVTAAAPNNLQQRGAFISQGGTTTAAGTLTLLSDVSTLSTILGMSKAIASLTWLSAVVTVTTATAHGFTSGDVIPVTIAGAVPSGYNGSFTATVTGTTTLTYPLANNPGTETTPGTITLGSVSELVQMNTTYFAGNGVPGVYVLELGEGTATEGVAALTSFINDTLGTTDQMYAYLVPREWDANAAFLSFLPNYTSTSAMTYFYVTTTVANEAVYSGPAFKCVYAQVESPNKVATEFSAASPFGNALKQSPSSTNRVVPLCYSPSYGTTAYPLRGNQSVFSGLSTNKVGWIGTGQEGGITSNILFQGYMSDGNDWNFWYSTDWIQVQGKLALANEVINGSASSVNPLYYNQQGINRLQKRVVQVASNGVAYGLGNGQVIQTKLSTTDFLANYNAGLYADQIVVNAEPFTTYTSENPNDYGLGVYGGITVLWVTQLGFKQIILNIQATNIISA